MTYRYRLVLEYDGGPFCGWQRQANGRSVQGELEQAGERLSGAPALAVAAGRTDTGVHALAMTAHIDLCKEFTADTVCDALNFYLKPWPVAVLDAELVDKDFSARFSAVRRHYLYRFISRRAPLALDAGKMWRLPVPLDAEAMDAAAQALCGQHDFTTFRASQCQAASPVKSLEKISVRREGDEVHLRCSAQSFLHNQVRSFAGSLVQVGLGREPVSWIGEILAAADRNACGPVAPAAGLYFVKADYPGVV